MLGLFLRRLREADTAPSAESTCPFCGGQLHVTYDTYLRSSGEPALGMIAECEACRTKVAVDSGTPLPVWAPQPKA